MGEVIDLGAHRLCKSGDAWWDALEAFVDRELAKGIGPGEYRPCPACGEADAVLFRGPRNTFAGPEAACVQAYCNRCVEGGEYRIAFK